MLTGRISCSPTSSCRVQAQFKELVAEKKHQVALDIVFSSLQIALLVSSAVLCCNQTLGFRSDHPLQLFLFLL